MTIRTKLTMNVGVVSAAIIIIVVSALVGTRKINLNIQELTQKTTPYQLKALNQQRELQAHATNLVTLSASRTKEDLKAASTNATASLAMVNKASDEMAKLKGQSASGDKTISQITRSMQEITEQKITAQDAAAAASRAIQERLSDASRKMSALGASVGKLQQKASGSMITSVDSLIDSNQQQNNLVVVRDGFKDLTLFISKIPIAGDKRSVAVLRDSVTGTVRTMNQALGNVKGMDKTAADYTQRLNGLNERVAGSRGLAFLKLQQIGEEDESKKEVIETRAKEALYEISYMAPVVDKAIENANSNLKSNTGDLSKNIDSFKSSNTVLSQSSNLSMLGSSLVNHINECIHSNNLVNFNKQFSVVDEDFRQAGRIGQGLKDLLARQKNATELQIVNGYLASIASVKSSFSGAGGAADKVRAALKNAEDLEKLNNQMREITGKFLEESKKEVTRAGANQDDVVTSLNVTANRTVQMVMAVGGLVVVITLIMGIAISRSITSPLKSSVDVIQKIAEGDLTQELACASKDEIGELAQSVNTMRVKMGSAVGQSVDTSQKLSAGVSEQAASLEETSSSLEEMSSMIKRNAENTTHANRLMSSTKEVTQKANASMNELTRSMDEISRSSEETQKIVKTIDEIAFQTNLLALNAAVEAARAGDAGAGFAVVAGEVRSLALRAAEAAKNTTYQMEDISKKIKTVESLVAATNEDFQLVNESSVKVSDLMNEVSSASMEQSQGIDQINKSVAAMNKITQENANCAQELAMAMKMFVIEKGVAGDSKGNGKALGKGNGKAPGKSAGPQARGGEAFQGNRVARKAAVRLPLPGNIRAT